MKLDVRAVRNPKDVKRDRGRGAFFSVRSARSPRVTSTAPAAKFRDDGHRVLGSARVHLIFGGSIGMMPL